MSLSLNTGEFLGCFIDKNTLLNYYERLFGHNYYFMMSLQGVEFPIFTDIKNKLAFSAAFF